MGPMLYLVQCDGVRDLISAVLQRGSSSKKLLTKKMEATLAW